MIRALAELIALLPFLMGQDYGSSPQLFAQQAPIVLCKMDFDASTADPTAVDTGGETCTLNSTYDPDQSTVLIAGTFTGYTGTGSSSFCNQLADCPDTAKVTGDLLWRLDTDNGHSGATTWRMLRDGTNQSCAVRIIGSSDSLLGQCRDATLTSSMTYAHDTTYRIRMNYNAILDECQILVDPDDGSVPWGTGSLLNSSCNGVDPSSPLVVAGWQHIENTANQVPSYADEIALCDATNGFLPTGIRCE